MLAVISCYSPSNLSGTAGNMFVSWLNLPQAREIEPEACAMHGTRQTHSSSAAAAAKNSANFNLTGNVGQSYVFIAEGKKLPGIFCTRIPHSYRLHIM